MAEERTEEIQESTTGLLDVLIDTDAPKSGESDTPSPSPPAVLSLEELYTIPPETLSSDQLLAALASQPVADVPAICLRLLAREIDNPALARKLVQAGLEKADQAFRTFESQVGGNSATGPGREDVEVAWKGLADDGRDAVRRYVGLSAIGRKMEAWGDFAGTGEATAGGNGSVAGEAVKSRDGDEVMDIDDPWAEAAEAEDIDIDDPWNDAASDKPPSITTKSTTAVKSAQIPLVDEEPPIQLSTFIHQSILHSAIDFASTAFIPGLKSLRNRYPELIWPVRTSLIHCCPEWVSPDELDEAGLLPKLGSYEKEGNPRNDKFRDASSILPHLSDILNVEPSAHPELHRLTEPMTTSDVQDWYTSHILSLDEAGQIDLQLHWVQHAESMGISGIDELGEDLSLLSRLVYDSDIPPSQNEKWSLETWRSSTPTQIIFAYISASTASTIVRDVKSRVLPYLYVLESRAERSGSPDILLIERYLCETILSLPLTLALPVFEASKATVSKSDRIIKDDLNVARLALACLYGSDQRDVGVWGIMSSIFECLPVWELSGRNPQDDAELTATTLESIAAFIRPTTSQPTPPKAADLMMFFQPLPFASLSRALDILDVHLESGEILARWEVPVQLRFLLQSSRDAKDQIELAEKMVRKAAVSGVRAGMREGEKTRLGGGGGEEGKWARLWADMLRLNGSGDQLLRGAFGMVDCGELMRVYLGGLLRSGKLDMARKTVRRLETEHGLKPETLESVVLSTSRELYEGAENGNIHTGDMKVAYDCLSIAQPTPSIQNERAFIEATSRLSTFSLPSLSPHGGSLSPQEIRHTRHRLDLLASVLQHSPDAFRHEQMLLDLADKLGVGTRVEKGRVWGMMASTAAEKGEWEVGDEYVAKAAEVVKESRNPSGRGMKKASDPEAENSQMARLREDVWRSAYIIGSAADYSDVGRKMDLLGLAVDLCPAEEVEGVLKAWRQVEDGRIKLDTAAKRRRLAGIPGGEERGRMGHTRGTSATSSTAWASPNFDLHEVTSLHPSEEDRVLGSRTAARAAKMAFDIGGRLGSRIPPIPLQLPISSLPHLPRSGSPATGYSLSRTTSRPEGGRTDSPSSVRSTSAERLREGIAGRVSGEYGRALDAIASLRGGADGESGERNEQALGMEDVERVKRGAQRALRQGVGWLLGADEGET